MLGLINSNAEKDTVDEDCGREESLFVRKK